jgi:hypothetical protein
MQITSPLLSTLQNSSFVTTLPVKAAGQQTDAEIIRTSAGYQATVANEPGITVSASTLMGVEDEVRSSVNFIA